MIDIKNEIEKIIRFIKERPAQNGVVIGISGGKDSAVVAALCVKALGADKVLGLLLPNGDQSDISDSYKVCNFLGIKYKEINIKSAVEAVQRTVVNPLPYTVPPRIRMTFLYAVAAERGMLVTCNSNLSESTIGYSTKWGDNVGDFAPIAHLTKTEVVAVGEFLGLPSEIIYKEPADGLTGKTDEQNFGFTYNQLDAYIRGGEIEQSAREKIECRIATNRHKSLPIPKVHYN